MKTKMVTVAIDFDEWCPVYDFSEPGFGRTCQISPSTRLMIKKAFRDFQRAQKALKKAYGDKC